MAIEIPKCSKSNILYSIINILLAIIIAYFLIIYTNTQINEKAHQIAHKNIEYVTIKDSPDLVPGAARLRVGSVIDFPISHSGDSFNNGYILVDDVTGVKYIYVNYGKNRVPVMTRYWEKIVVDYSLILVYHVLIG